MLCSVRLLVERGEFDLALRTVELALASPGSSAEQAVLLEAVRLVPEAVRAVDPQGALLTVRLLGNTRQPAGVLDFAAVVRAAMAREDALPPQDGAFAAVFAYAAWANVRLARYAEALAEAEGVTAHLQGLPLGIAQRARGEALFWLGRDGWQDAFRAARAQLSGRALGTCLLEEGVLLERAGDDLGAQRAWREALPLLEGDPVYAAWLRHNIGLSCLRLGWPEAEDHFVQLDRLARHPRAREFKARAACGVGAARRLRGELPRAEASYRAALKLAREEDDLRQAWWGLGLTLRLAGKPGLALEALGRAATCTAEDAASGCSPVFVDVAAAHLALGDEAAAREALTRAARLSAQDADRAAVVRAELARRAGNEAQAVRLLREVRPGLSCAREEARLFPEVFRLLDAPLRPVPLAHVAAIRVEVRALGALSVRVNGRAVPLRATSRAGELLVALLERRGRATTEELVELLYPTGARDGRRAGQALWTLARTLAAALGWHASVRFVEGAYALDEDAQWWYDVREAEARGEPTPAFLSGVYADWVQERARELAART